MIRAIKTLLFAALLAAIAGVLGFAVTMTIGWGVEWPLAGYLMDAVWVLLTAGVAWGSFCYFRVLHP